MSEHPSLVRLGSQAAAATDTGRFRVHNEDAFLLEALLGPTAELPVQLLGVLDGCGGVASGRIASDCAAEVIAATLRPADRDELARFASRYLDEAIQLGSREVFRRARDPHERGMGTTATIALAIGDSLHVAHVGDSRARVLRRSKLTQVSRDHTLVNAMLEAGELRLEDVADFPHQGVVTQVLGTKSEDLAVDHTTVRLRRGDRLVLATDGLDALTSGEIAEILARAPSPAAGCTALLDWASLLGGEDNATVVVAHFGDEAFPPPGVGDALEERGGPDVRHIGRTGHLSELAYWARAAIDVAQCREAVAQVLGVPTSFIAPLDQSVEAASLEVTRTAGSFRTLMRVGVGNFAYRRFQTHEAVELVGKELARELGCDVCFVRQHWPSCDRRRLQWLVATPEGTASDIHVMLDGESVTCLG